MRVLCVRAAVGYVEQNDIHSPQVTVEESLMFSAQLRLMGVSRGDLRTFVMEVPCSRFCLYCLLGKTHRHAGLLACSTGILRAGERGRSSLNHNLHYVRPPCMQPVPQSLFSNSPPPSSCCQAAGAFMALPIYTKPFAAHVASCGIDPCMHEGLHADWKSLA